METMATKKQNNYPFSKDTQSYIDDVKTKYKGMKKLWVDKQAKEYLTDILYGSWKEKVTEVREEAQMLWQQKTADESWVSEYEAKRQFVSTNEVRYDELKVKLWQKEDINYDPDIWPVDLTEWRDGIETWNEKENPKKYIKYLKELHNFIKDKTKFEETARDVTIKEAWIKIDKKPVWLDILKHPKNTDGDVFIYEWPDYNGVTKKMVGIRQKVLNDPKHPMYEPIQDIIKQRKKEWYRLATTQDLKKTIGVLPTKKEEEWLLWIEMLAWLFGWWVLEPTRLDKSWNVNVARSFVLLFNYGTDRLFHEFNLGERSGSLFFVQDC